MQKIIDTNEYIEKYNFGNLITAEDNKEIMRISKDLIDAGQYFTNSPKYQTKANLFARPEPVWLKMRQSFIYSCFMFLGKEVRIKGINSWVYMTKYGDDVDRKQLWHHHHYDLNHGKVSGIWYVHLPEDVGDINLAGTEFALDGVEGENKVFVTPAEYTWVVYPSKLWHRPGPTTNKENYRFVFAADLEYFL
jgi:hypothetical protein